MSELTLAKAQAMIADALAHARGQKLQPMAVAVLDSRGALKAFAAEEGTSLKRGEIAIGKAYGALSMGLGSRSLFKRAQEQPFFIAAVTHAVGGCSCRCRAGCSSKVRGVCCSVPSASLATPLIMTRRRPSRAFRPPGSAPIPG